MSEASWELFHRISDPDSAKVRGRLTGGGFADRVKFRNVDASEQALLDLQTATGGDRVPVLRIAPAEQFVGVDEILAYLQTNAQNK